MLLCEQGLNILGWIPDRTRAFFSVELMSLTPSQDHALLRLLTGMNVESKFQDSVYRDTHYNCLVNEITTFNKICQNRSFLD